MNTIERRIINVEMSGTTVEVLLFAQRGRQLFGVGISPISTLMLVSALDEDTTNEDKPRQLHQHHSVKYADLIAAKESRAGVLEYIQGTVYSFLKYHNIERIQGNVDLGTRVTRLAKDLFDSVPEIQLYETDIDAIVPVPSVAWDDFNENEGDTVDGDGKRDEPRIKVATVTLEDVKGSFEGISGVSIKDVTGIYLCVVSQDALEGGVTENKGLLFSKEMRYTDGVNQYRQDYIQLKSDMEILDNFEYEDVRGHGDIGAQEIRECMSDDLIDFIDSRFLKVFWGDKYENKMVEVVDFHNPKPELRYQFGTTSAT
jgi:hypothetical protein